MSKDVQVRFLSPAPTRTVEGVVAQFTLLPSSSGLGHRPFKATARVQISLGVPVISNTVAWSSGDDTTLSRW